MSKITFPPIPADHPWQEPLNRLTAVIKRQSELVKAQKELIVHMDAYIVQPYNTERNIRINQLRNRIKELEK